MYETHCHTTLCRHATGSPREYALEARRRGLKGLTITCHNPLPDGISQEIRMREEEFPLYLDLVEKLRQDVGEVVDVRLGLEADYMPGLERYLEKQLGSADFDYILGSVHWHMPEWRERFWSGSRRLFVEAYFEQLAVAAETGLFDCLSHPDLIKNFIGETWSFEQARSSVARALDRIARTGVAMELNTSGRLKSYAEFNPGPEMLLMMKEREIPVVVGADAHSPDRVGDHFGEALDALERAGYRRVRCYRRRTPELLSLTAAREGLTSGKR